MSYNFNYGQFSQAMFGEGRLLLDYPDFVADTWLNLASATWFYTTPQVEYLKKDFKSYLTPHPWLNIKQNLILSLLHPQPPKPSMLHVIDGTWQPNEVDRRNGIVPVGLQACCDVFMFICLEQR